MIRKYLQKYAKKCLSKHIPYYKSTRPMFIVACAPMEHVHFVGRILYLWCSSLSRALPGLHQGCGKYHARLVRLIHFHSGQVENFYLLGLGQVQMNKGNTILYFIF